MRQRRQLITTVTDRRELPIVVRHPREFRPVFLLFALAVMALLGSLNMFSGRGLPGVGLPASSPFQVEAVELRPEVRATATIWRVTGKIINTSKATASAPDLRVRLLRSDGGEAAAVVVRMRAQIVPGFSAVAFSTRLSTANGETLSAEVAPIPARKGSDRE